MRNSPRRPSRQASAQAAPPARAAEIAALIGVLALVGAGIFFVSRRPAPAAASLLAAMDISGSKTESERRKDCGVLNAVIESVMEPATPSTIWAFDATPRKVYEGRPIEAREMGLMQRNLIQEPSQGEGTRPGKALQAMLPVARDAAEEGRRVAVVLLWDGDDANPIETKAAAEEMAQLPEVTLWVAGVPDVRGLRDGVERSLAPLKGRLIVSGPYDSQQALDRFREAMHR